MFSLYNKELICNKYYTDITKSYNRTLMYVSDLIFNSTNTAQHSSFKGGKFEASDNETLYHLKVAEDGKIVKEKSKLLVAFIDYKATWCRIQLISELKSLSDNGKL